MYTENIKNNNLSEKKDASYIYIMYFQNAKVDLLIPIYNVHMYNNQWQLCMYISYTM